MIWYAVGLVTILVCDALMIVVSGLLWPNSTLVVFLMVAVSFLTAFLIAQHVGTLDDIAQGLILIVMAPVASIYALLGAGPYATLLVGQSTPVISVHDIDQHRGAAIFRFSDALPQLAFVGRADVYSYGEYKDVWSGWAYAVPLTAEGWDRSEPVRVWLVSEGDGKWPRRVDWAVRLHRIDALSSEYEKAAASGARHHKLKTDNPPLLVKRIESIESELESRRQGAQWAIAVPLAVWLALNLAVALNAFRLRLRESGRRDLR